MADLPDPLSAVATAFPSLASRAGSGLSGLVADMAQHRHAAGEVILSENQAHDSLYLICQGEVAIERVRGGARSRAGTLGPGKWFGEIGFLAQGASTADVVATQPSLILALPQTAFHRHLDQHPALADAILSEIIPGMSQRLRATRELVDGGDAPLTDTDAALESLFTRGLRALFGGAK